MSEMIDRMADVLLNWGCGTSDECEKIARALLPAMRLDPFDVLDPVLEAVQTEVDIFPEDQPRPAPNYVQFVSREEAAAIWNAGIDAALSEGQIQKEG